MSPTTASPRNRAGSAFGVAGRELGVGAVAVAAAVTSAIVVVMMALALPMLLAVVAAHAGCAHSTRVRSIGAADM